MLVPSRRASSGALLVLALSLLALGAQPASAVARPTRPNVVLVLTDDQTMESVAKMPYVSSQPWIDFTQATVENGLCCPSRASILQGRFDTHTGVMNNAQASAFDPTETLATSLQRAGYATGLFGKYFNGFNGGPPPPGWTDWQVPYTTALYNQYTYPLDNNGKKEWHGTTAASYQPDLLAARGASFISAQAKAGTPFFLYYAPTATHTPWVASPARTGAYATASMPRSASFNELDMSDKPAWIRGKPQRDPVAMDSDRRKEWTAALSVDDAIARLDAALKAAHVYDNTVVIFLTDNGYAFGEHRWVTKRCEYEECLRTPMLVRYPGQAARVDRTHLVTNVDLKPTIEQIAGASSPLPSDGASFLPFLRPDRYPAPTSWRDTVLLHWPGGNTTGLSGKVDSIPQFWGVRSTRDKYVELDTGEREYYDLVADPHELTNLATSPVYAARIAVLKSRLDVLKAQAGASRFVLNPSQPVPGEMPVDVD